MRQGENLRGAAWHLYAGLAAMQTKRIDAARNELPAVDEKKKRTHSRRAELVALSARIAGGDGAKIGRPQRLLRRDFIPRRAALRLRKCRGPGFSSQSGRRGFESRPCRPANWKKRASPWRAIRGAVLAMMRSNLCGRAERTRASERGARGVATAVVGTSAAGTRA